MNILLLCSKENLLGNKLVIYSTLYCNAGIDWYICLLEDIGEKEKQNLINLVKYLDAQSTITFEEISEEKSLEEQFYYLSNLFYISADCLISQAIDFWQFENKTLILPVVEKDWPEQRYCVFYLDLDNTRDSEKQTFIKYNNEYITDLIHNIDVIHYFDKRIGFCGQFSFYYNMPIIFWFSNKNKKIYKTKLKEWRQQYQMFEYFIDRILLIETINF